MFLIIKQTPDGRVYQVPVRDGLELGEHIKACYAATDQEVIGVVRVGEVIHEHRISDTPGE